MGEKKAAAATAPKAPQKRARSAPEKAGQADKPPPAKTSKGKTKS